MSFVVFDTKVANLPASLEWADNSAASTTSSSYVQVPGVANVIIPEGKWLLQASVGTDQGSFGITSIQFHRAGTPIGSEQGRQGHKFGTIALMTVADFDGSQVLELRYKVDTGTSTLANRIVCATPLGR